MATEKKFSVAGVSTLNGKTKIRFANDSMRIKILEKNGHGDTDFVNLPNEMTKGEIAQHLTAIGYGAGNPAILAAIAYVAKKNPVAVTATVTADESATVAA